MRWYILFFCSCRLFGGTFAEVAPSSPEEILSLTTDLLVDGLIAVPSGQISISEVDLTVKGAQDLSLKRTYVAPRVLGRYHDKDQVDRLALSKELMQLETKGWVVYPHLWAGYNRNSRYFQICDPRGFVLEFHIQGKKGILKTASYGCTNLRGEEASSAVDIRNIDLVYEGDWVVVTWPDGLQRHYFKTHLMTYRLEKEILPHGKMIRYEYDSQGMCKITSSDLSGQCIYASIVRVGNNHYVGSDGRQVDLLYERREIPGEYKKEGIREQARVQFPVMTRASNSAYLHAASYSERALLSAYDMKNYPISCTYFQGKNLLCRIQTYSNPSALFSFSYDPAIAGQKGGSTTVEHPNGMQTIYYFNKLLLLERVEKWFESKLVNRKAFVYDAKQHIKSIETTDGEGNLLLAKHFECDSLGNAVSEMSRGDFGTFTIKRIFDKNRILSEEYDNGLKYLFTYLDSTHLITSKTTLELGKQVHKTIYSYDDASNLVGIEEEDGIRTIYTLYQMPPHLHRIEWEERRDGEDRLIYKIHYSYDTWGNIQQEKRFDTDDRLAYTIERSYNEKGELLHETNPLQQKAIYEYDARGKIIYEKPFANDLVIHRIFDDKGRLTLLQEEEYETQFLYNASDQLIKKVDPLGCVTTYSYDPVHGKPVLIEEEGFITQISYDAFGRPITITDPLRGTTSKKYNGWGDVTEITHPEGGTEFFTYYPNALLASYRDPDGLITTYTYDAFGRMREKTIGTATTIFDYDGYHLCTISDPAGFITRYKYNLARQKVEEEYEGRITRYGYDHLGFLAWQERGGAHD